MYALHPGPFGSDESQTGGAQWRSDIEALFNYQRRDMRDALVQEKKLYPVNYAKHVIRPVAFVWSLSRELGTAYAQERPPQRRFIGLDGNPLPEATVELIEDEYKRSRTNRFMRDGHRHLIAMNNATIWVWPNQRTGGTILKLVPPHQQEVVLAGPFGVEEDDVAVWRMRIAVPDRNDPQLFSWSVAEVSVDRLDDDDKLIPGRAYWASSDNKKLQGRGIYQASDLNPFPLIPVVMMRGSEPGPGEFWAPAPQDILAAQRAINHDYTDVGTIARLQGFGQPVRKGAGPQDRELQLGPETAIDVGPDGDFHFAQADPKLEGYVLSNRSYVEGVIGMNGINPATFTKSIAITSTARQMEQRDRDNYRQEHKDPLEHAEQRLYDVKRQIVNWLAGTEVWPAARVEVEYREPAIPVDPLHDAQARDLDIKRHQTSEVKDRALRDGISEKQAFERIKAEIEQQKELDELAGVNRTPPPFGGGPEVTTPPPEDGEETDTPAPEMDDEELS